MALSAPAGLAVGQGTASICGAYIFRARNQAGDTRGIDSHERYFNVLTADAAVDFSHRLHSIILCPTNLHSIIWSENQTSAGHAF